MKQRWAVLVFTFSVSSGTVAQAGTHVAYAVESGRSRLQISVNKGGLFKVLGHEHLISANQVSEPRSVQRRNAGRSFGRSLRFKRLHSAYWRRLRESEKQSLD